MLAKQSVSSRGYDWAVVALSVWFLGGLVLDGWAHNHIPELESFFTPWHAVFYSRFLMQDHYRFIPAAALAGLRADLLIRWLKPSRDRSGALRLFAFTVPVWITCSILSS
jgi:hypothetical protein